MNDHVEIAVEGVCKRYRGSDGGVLALRDVSLGVAKGEILGLLGVNGAGKSTLVRILSTLLKPDSGIVSIGGHDVVREADAVRRSIGVAQQTVGLDESRPVRTVLTLHARLYGLSRSAGARRIEELLDVLRLQTVANKQIRHLSGGMRRKVDLALALVHGPSIVFLDEPTFGMDPPSRLEFWELIRRLRQQGVTILLTTQYLEEADHLADRVVILSEGRVVAEGTPKGLKETVGGSTLELDFADAVEAAGAATCLGKACQQMGQSVHLPISDPEALRVTLETLETEMIRPIAVRIEEPTLEQLFMRVESTALAPTEPTR